MAAKGGLSARACPERLEGKILETPGKKQTQSTGCIPLLSFRGYKLNPHPIERPESREPVLSVSKEIPTALPSEKASSTNPDSPVIPSEGAARESRKNNDIFIEKPLSSNWDVKLWTRLPELQAEGF